METTNYILKTCYELKKKTIFNNAPAKKIDKEICKYIDYLILNRNEFEYVFEIYTLEFDEIIKKKEEMCIGKMIITLGEKGSIFIDDKQNILSFDAYNVDAIDTRSAGDAFIGAFASKIVNGYSDYDAIRYATAVSAIVVSNQGASESIPNIQEIDEFIIKKQGDLK